MILNDDSPIVPIMIYEYIYKSLFSFSQYGLTLVDMYKYIPLSSSSPSNFLTLMLNTMNMPLIHVPPSVLVALCKLVSTLITKMSYPEPPEAKEIDQLLFNMCSLLCIKIKEVGNTNDELLLHLAILLCDICTSLSLSFTQLVDHNADNLLKETPDTVSYMNVVYLLLQYPERNIASIPLDLCLHIQVCYRVHPL